MADIIDILTNAWKAAKRSRDWHRGEAANFSGQMEKIFRAAEAIGLRFEDDGVVREYLTPDEGVSVERVDEIAPAGLMHEQRHPELTMKEAAVEVLKTNQRPMTTNQILGELNQMLGTAYPRSSLSPQLSRLKADNRIHRVDGLWVYSQMDEVSDKKEDPPAKEASEPKSVFD